MAFDRFYRTVTGADYLAQTLINKKVVFTKAQIGDGYLPAGTSITSLTALINPLKYIPIQNMKVNKGTAVLQLQFSNQDGAGILPEFWWSELAVWGYVEGDDTRKEAIIFVANAGSKENADKIPQTLTEFVYNLSTKITDVENFSLAMDSEAYIPIRETGNAKYLTFEDGTTLQEKFDNGEIAGTGEQILEKLQQVAGEGSGLDADLLDGKHAADFAQLDDTGKLPVDVIPEDAGGGGLVIVPVGEEAPLPERKPGYLYFIEKDTFSLKVTPEFTVEMVKTRGGA